MKLLITFFFCSFLSISLYSKESSTSKNIFSLEEQQWIKEHPVIRVGSEMDWAPFDYVEYNKPKGMAIDHINLLAKKIGIKIKFINGYTWAELLELLEAKKIDVLPVLYKNSQREKYALYTTPFYRGKLGIVTTINNKISKENLSSNNIRVGMQKNNGSIIIVREQIPDIKINEIQTNDELVKQLATGKLDAIIGNPLVYYHIAREEQINNISVSDYVEMTKKEQLDTSFHIGVRNDYKILHQIIQKAMNQTTPQEYMDIEKKWTSIVYKSETDWGLIGKIVLAILFVISFLVWNNKKLQSLVKKKTKELESLNSELELKVQIRTKELQEVNKELEQLSNTDTLTNIYNRRYVFNIAEEIIKLTIREKSTFSVAMLDIDKFKNINDTYGHDIGDKILQSFVYEVQSIIRESDVFSRFGGEEFLIIFPNTNAKSACVVCEKIRTTIENSSFTKNISFTVSIGLSEFNTNDIDINSAISRADKLLYKAKETGRNKIES